MASNLKISAKEIVAMPIQSVWALQDGIYDVTFDDGVVLSTRKTQVIFNRYCWELFTLFPNTPIISSCDVNTVIGSGFFNATTHIEQLETIFKHICKVNGLREYSSKEPLLRMSYVITNRIFNEIVHSAGRYVGTIDATDFTGLVTDKAIVNIHDNLKATPESVERSYKEIRQYINDSVNNNRFVNAYRSKAINENQANQCIGPRGFVTDLDRSVFRQPILSGFIRGLNTLYELLTESRTAAKSLNANDTHIRTSEYASRRIQLLSMSVTGVDTVDCGSTEYMDLLITPVVLDNLHGTYYLKDDGTLDVITGNETNLIDKIIKVRTALGCKCKDHHHICTTCLGEVSNNFRENSNLGYTMVAFLMEKLTQSILSTKHLTHSVKKSIIRLSGLATRYFHVDGENNLYFNKDINLAGLELILPNNKLGKLVDVLNLPHTNIALNKIGELEVISIRDTKPKTPTTEVVDISYKDRLSIITKPLLEYIKTTTLTSDSRGNFVIPLDKFDKTKPIFSNPLKETNIISFVNRIASMIETSKDKTGDPYDKLTTLFNTVIDQFKCNFAVLSVIVYSITTRDPANGDYRHGRNAGVPKCENKVVLFRNRSISQLLVFEEQAKELLNSPEIIFSNIHRQDHPCDVLFSPQSIIKS